MGIGTHEVTGGDVIGIEQPGQFCTATTRAGRRCRGIPLQGEGLCFAHSERLAEKRHQAQAAGGRAISERRKLLCGQIDFSTAATIQGFLESLVRAGVQNIMSTGKAKDLASIAQVAVQVRQVSDLELIGQRLSALEENLGLSSEGDE
jgi:hypothetical protein